MLDPKALSKIKEDTVIKTRSITIAECEMCGDRQNVYLCENHQTIFCKPCLMSTYTFRNRTYFKAKCKGVPMNCVYNPLGNKKEV